MNRMVFQPEISNPRLADLDRKAGGFYELVYRYFSSWPNPYRRQVCRERSAELLGQADRIKPETEFDELVLRNIYSNVALTDLSISYFTDPDFPLSVREFFDRIGGEGAWDYLETRVQSVPWERKWNLSEEGREKDRTRIEPFADEAREAIQRQLPQIERDVIEYGQSTGYLPSDFNMKIELTSPEDLEYDYWKPKERVFGLALRDFHCSRENGEVTVDPAAAYLAAFHEVLGHAAHQVHSERMPISLRMAREIGIIPSVRPVTEGVALQMEKECYNFLEGKVGELSFTRKDVAYLEQRAELRHQRVCETVCYSLVRERELNERDFDGYKHVLALTQNRLVARRFECGYYGDLVGSWMQVGVALGPMHYQRMQDMVKRELGEKALDQNEAAFGRASRTGVWSWEVYPDAVVYLLRNEPMVMDWQMRE